MFDFAADARDEGGVKGRNNKGLVTYDRKTKKDAFYIYQAYWTSEPMIHVCGERFVDRAPEERNITVYTNCPSVSLIVNGSEAACKEAVDHAVVFENVELNEGANTITAVSGDVKGNTITLNGVSGHNYAYDLPEGNQGANWFDDPAAVAARNAFKYPKGYFSIKDKIGVLMENEHTAAIVGDLMQKVTSSSAMAEMAGGGQSTQGGDNAMADLLNMMRLSDILKMAGSAITLEMKQQLNEALTKIKKA